MEADKHINRDDDAFSYIVSLFKRIPSRFWFAFAGTFIFGLAAHMYMFTNTLLVHDSVLHVRFDELYVDIVMGRLGDTLVRFLRGFMSVPWLLGLISLLCFSVSSYVVCLTLNIKRPTVVMTLSAIMVTFPAVAMGNCYVFNIDVFAVYIMLSCLSVYVANKSKCGFLFGTIILVAGLLVYQAALSVAASLCLLSLMISVLNKDESIKNAFFKALRFLFMLVVGTLIYYAIWMISIKVFDMQLPDYQNMNQVGQFSSIGSFIALVIKACRESILFFLKPYRYGYYPIYLYIATLFGIAATCYRAIAVIVEMPTMREKLCRISLLIILCVFLCLSMDVMLVMTNGAPTHFLQRYAFVSPLASDACGR